MGPVGLVLGTCEDQVGEPRGKEKKVVSADADPAPLEEPFLN